MTRLAIRALALVFVCSLAAAAAQADFRLEKELTLAPGGELLVDVAAGKITVRGTDRSGARVVVTSSRDDIEDRYDLSFSSSNGRAVVRAEKRGSFVERLFGWNSGSLHWDIQVPRSTSLELDTSGGRIDVSDIDGVVVADTSGGAITAENIRGETSLDTSGGAINAERIVGDLNADTSGGSISVEDVTGSVVADTSGGSISIRGVGGRVTASSSGGPVTAYFTEGNSAGGSLSTSGGRVTAYVDPGAQLDVDIATSGGRASVDLPVTVQGSMSRTSIRGSLNGGGALLRLRSSGGSVAVKAL